MCPQDQPPKVARHSVALQPGSLVQLDVAWPTVLLAVVSVTAWLFVTLIGVAWSLPLWSTLPVSTMAVYCCFTPMHDATHGSVSKKHRWLNEAVGWLCCTPFLLVPHPLFRWIHLRHHKNTNDPELDPDHFSGDSLLMLPFQLLSVIPTYARHLKRYGSDISSTTWLEACVFWGMIFSTLLAGCQYGHGGLILQFVVLPPTCAILFLGLVFDYLPHHPHTVTRQESVYGGTSTIDGIFGLGSGESSRLLTWLMFGQNFHSMHHLYPTIPFYTYAKVWHDHKEAFISAGVPVVTLAGLFGRGRAVDKPNEKVQ